MYFDDDIKINKFKNGFHFSNHLNYLFCTDSAHKWANEHTTENECYNGLSSKRKVAIQTTDIKQFAYTNDGGLNDRMFIMIIIITMMYIASLNDISFCLA